MTIMSYDVSAEIMDIDIDSDIVKLKLDFDQLDHVYTINVKAPPGAGDFEIINSFDSEYGENCGWGDYYCRDFKLLVEEVNNGEFDVDMEVELAVEIENNEKIIDLIQNYATNYISDIHQSERSLETTLAHNFSEEAVKYNSKFYYLNNESDCSTSSLFGYEAAILRHEGDYYMCSGMSLVYPGNNLDWTPEYLYRIPGNVDDFINKAYEAIADESFEDFIFEHNDVKQDLGYNELVELRKMPEQKIQCTLNIEQKSKAISM